MNNNGAVVIERPERRMDILDIRMTVFAGVDALCEHFGLAGPAARKFILGEMAAQAREMREQL